MKPDRSACTDPMRETAGGRLVRPKSGCHVAVNSGHPQFVCHGLTELHSLKGSGRGIEEALGSHQQRDGG
jgi:hypothetical protein